MNLRINGTFKVPDGTSKLEAVVRLFITLKAILRGEEKSDWSGTVELGE